MVKSKKMLVYIRYSVLPSLAFFMLMMSGGCRQQTKDQNIKADLTAKAKGELDFAAVSFTVENGIVTLTGTCSSEKSKQQVEQTVKSINIVKGIVDQILVEPVLIKADVLLKAAADSILSSYPTMKVEVNSGTITLKGKAKNNDITKILPALNSLHANKIVDQLKLQ